MLHAYSAEAVRAAEQPLLHAGRGPELMRTAAYGLAMSVAAMLRSRGVRRYGARALLLVGSGNNGGDALYAGAWLASRGTRTTAVLTSARVHPDALAAFRQAGGRCLTLEPDHTSPTGAQQVAGILTQAAGSDVVIDGVLGTGGRGGLRGSIAGLVGLLDALEGAQRPAIVACDLPSGIDATTGEVHGIVLRADCTVTFGAHKTGLLAAPAEQLCGEVRLVDLGISSYLGAVDAHRLEAADLAVLLPAARPTDHKYTRGVAGIIAGSARYPGAALLAVAAASACGPGMLHYLGPGNVAQALHLRNPEVVCSAGAPGSIRVQSWVVGPGIDGDDEQLQRAGEAMATGLPTVVDAGALALVLPGASAGDRNGSLILTPHAGELAAMFSRHGIILNREEIAAAPLAAARRAADFFAATVLLKGATTVIAAPDGTLYTQANGTPKLATAGSGDTLAGILGALLAMRTGAEDHSLVRTAALAAALHGELSVQDAHAPLNAGQLAQRISPVWAQLCHPDSALAHIQRN